jgi:hypothetical protein
MTTPTVAPTIAAAEGGDTSVSAGHWLTAAAISDVLITAWAAADPAAPTGRRLRDAAAAAATWHATARAAARATITDLAARLDNCRREQEEATAAQRALRIQIDRFRTAVRRRVIEAVNEGHICRQGANTALAEWDMPALRGEYDATVAVDVEVVVAAVDDDSAEQTARQTIVDECAQLADDEIDSLYDIDIDDLQPLDEQELAGTDDRGGPDGQNTEDGADTRAIAYRIEATLRAHLTVSAADEDDAADAAVGLVRDRAGGLDQVTATDPRCTAASETTDGYLDPDWD